MIHLKSTRTKYDNAEAITDLVQFISATIESDYRSELDRRFKPYASNEGDITSWILDSNNNWRITFIESDIFRLSYRYSTPERDPAVALATWLTFRMLGLEIVPNPYFSKPQNPVVA